MDEGFVPDMGHFNQPMATGKRRTARRAFSMTWCLNSCASLPRTASGWSSVRGRTW